MEAIKHPVKSGKHRQNQKFHMTILILASILCVTLLSSCDIQQKSPDDTKTELGITQADVKKKLNEYVQYVYNPNDEADLQLGVNVLKDLCTPDLYKRLESRIGKYDETVKQSIVSCDIYFQTKDKSTDHMEHIWLEFIWQHAEVMERIACEFTVNPENKLSTMSMHTGGWMKS